MIIDCINCAKKFDVNADLIPVDGRTIQCGSCNHLWFFKKEYQKINEIIEDPKVESPAPNLIDKINNNDLEINKQSNDDKILDDKIKTSVKKIKKKSSFTFVKFLSYILVIIISFIGMLVIIDTFKHLLFEIFPNLELLLFSFYETIKDIQLFIKDLI